MDIVKQGMHTAMKRGKLQAKATFTPAPIDLAAIEKRAAKLLPANPHRKDVYACLAEIERLKWL